MNRRMMEQVAALQTELSGWVRLTGTAAMAKIKQAPHDTGRWVGSALTVFARWEATAQTLRDENDPDAAKLLATLEQFDKEKVKAGVRVVLSIIVSQAHRDGRLAFNEGLSSARVLLQSTLATAKRAEQLKLDAEQVVGPLLLTTEVHSLPTPMLKAMKTLVEG